MIQLLVFLSFLCTRGGGRKKICFGEPYLFHQFFWWVSVDELPHSHSYSDTSHAVSVLNTAKELLFCSIAILCVSLFYLSLTYA